jgi:hypothetical protein
MKWEDIIPDTLIYYDKNHKKRDFLSKLITNNNQVETIIKNIFGSGNLDNHQIILKYQNLTVTLEYEVICVYSETVKTWIWGWAYPILNPRFCEVAKKIFIHGFNMDSDDIDLKTFLVTSRFFVKNIINLDIYLSYIANIVNNPYIIGIVKFDESDIIYYIMLKDKDKIDQFLTEISKN